LPNAVIQARRISRGAISPSVEHVVGGSARSATPVVVGADRAVQRAAMRRAASRSGSCTS
jgi:hypothetical protein